MRPGPGLVVMALAFISGARRGSTSTSSKSSSSTTSPSSPSAFFTTTTSDTSFEPTTPSLLFPEYLGGGGVLTADTKTLPNHPQKETGGKTYRIGDYNYIYNSLFYLPPFVPPRHKIIQDDLHLRLETLSGLKSNSRATRQTRIIHNKNAGERNQNAESDGGEGVTADISVGDSVNKEGSTVGSESGSGYELEDGIISVEDKNSEGITAAGTSVSGDSEALPVQFPSNSADASRSFDEDDILALVAEDDLLSEESFDRLTKFTDDKIGYVIVDDYDAASEDSTSGVSESSLASAVENQQQDPQDDNYTANERNIGNENGSGETAEFQNEQKYTNRKDKDKVVVKGNNNQNIKEKVFAKSIENSHDSLTAVADISFVAAISENGLSHTFATDSDNSVRNTKWLIFESESPLTRLNPWISACDLAQPGGTAPDLQGQCSAGTLPVAWVDEGPGPPACPISCERLKSSIFNNFNTKSNNNNSNLKRNYKVNLKTSTDNHHQSGKMLKVRRDLNPWKGNDSTEISNGDQGLLGTGIMEQSRKKVRNAASTSLVQMKPFQAQQYDNMAIALALASSNRQHQANNNIVKINTNQAESRMPYEYSDYINFGSKYESNTGRTYNNNKQKKQYPGYREQQQQQQPPLQQQKQHQQKEQQCLDYLGDTEETSPAHLCTFKSPGELAARLRSLRLHHCCERNVFSALHTVALNATLSGGVECVRILMDVMDLDVLATRITCELAEILFRFDCRQVYSQIHQCDDCKEAYRRWVCSTLVPYFAEESDISVSPSNNYNNNNNNRNNSKTDNRTNSTSTKNSDKSIINVVTSNKTGRLFPNENNNNKLHDAVDSIEEATQRTKRQLSHNITISNPSPPNSDVANNSETSAVLKRSKRNLDGRCNRHQQQQQQQEWRQEQQKHPKQSKQSNIFISTAINADPCTEDPVISKIIKRSKRKVQFRKRRRIRPCLSVCQTVEQKCPYLLPADRAPALPTQYAGEPTFLCLDQSIPETGEQLRKSTYGPSECCYSYCENIAEGICTYCNDFIHNAIDVSIPAGNSTRRLHNITLTATSPYRLDTRLEASLANDSTNKLAASISIALTNSSTTAVGSQIDRLPYYALYDGIYYYDENTADMPEAAMSDDCPPVPSVTSRCTIPYYASSAAALRTQQKTVPNDMIGHHMLLLLSAMLCLLTSQSAAMQLKNETHPNQKQLRKYIIHSTKPANINGLSTEAEHSDSAALYVVKKSVYLVLRRTEYLQQLRGAEDSTIERIAGKSTRCSSSRENPTRSTIFSTFTVCTYYFSRGIYESSNIRHCVQDCGGRVHCYLEENFSRSRSRSRNKTKDRKGSRNLNRNRSRNRNRNRPVSGNEIVNGKIFWERNTISQVCSVLKESNKTKISPTEYSGSVRYKYVGMNIGNNNKITYRLNSQLYFNSKTKIYRSKKCSKFRNFNIATNTDYNRNHTNEIINTTTSNTNKYSYKYNYNNNNNNINNNNNKSIDRFKSYYAERNCQFIYYYNFNINDWWRRWWWCPWSWFTQPRSLVIL
ncbi:uncharacterized protein LOC129246218 [Anastrepha obliqua]|uniref:uncharacterized protein LOC129246218 n=1 Tax=Anastrepha obliqua TaxID=95512 RepID=UPI00240A4D32|nr:uncharacterized protein LOC129246218 [Anastrepha obliqua]